MNIRKIKAPLLAFLCISLCTILASCKDSTSNDENEQPGNNNPAKETSGYVTYYTGALASDVAYYVPEIENGWYRCAVSEEKLNDIPPGSAIELSANGKTVHLLVTDLCPNSTNSHHTKNPSYFFDLEQAAFERLADKSVGILNMTFKTIPYPTSKNIGFISTATEEWNLQGRFFNMRHPLRKVEYSLDGGNNFSEMQKVSKDNNLYCIDGKKIEGKITFRLTDIRGEVVTSNPVTKPATNSRVDTGTNLSF